MRLFTGRRGPLGLFVAALTAVSCTDSARKIQTSTAQNEISFRPNVIYGEDDRLDLFQVTDANTLRLADSTMALVRSSQIKPNSDGTADIAVRNYGEAFNLCPDEPFRDQDTAAFCSGFLIAPDVVITAGHCLRTSTQCATTRFVFGFGLRRADQPSPTIISQDQIYSCRQLVRSEVVGSGADYAVVRLDRAVQGRTPLAVRRDGTPGPGDPLLVIGHPSGLPTKVAGGARVRSLQRSHLVADLDTYGGNSGSAVFNARTGFVEGILVRGDTDFVTRGSCRVSNRCPQSGCRGEDVTLISEVLPHLPAVFEGRSEAVYSQEVWQDIPDNETSGIVSRLTVPEGPMGRNVSVGVMILHPWRGDLAVTLVTPGGRELPLHARSGGGAKNLEGTFGRDLESVSDLTPLSQIMEGGDWTLRVSDRSKRDAGQLVSWSLRFEALERPDEVK